MGIVLVTGSAGLVGSESVTFFCERGFTVAGIDNDMRKLFFGKEASTAWNRDRLLELYPDRYRHHDADIRDREATGRIFETYGSDIDLIIHAAAQPSHAAAEPVPSGSFRTAAAGRRARDHRPRHVHSRRTEQEVGVPERADYDRVLVVFPFGNPAAPKPPRGLMGCRRLLERRTGN